PAPTVHHPSPRLPLLVPALSRPCPRIVPALFTDLSGTCPRRYPTCCRVTARRRPANRDESEAARRRRPVAVLPALVPCVARAPARVGAPAVDAPPGAGRLARDRAARPRRRNARARLGLLRRASAAPRARPVQRHARGRRLYR